MWGEHCAKGTWVSDCRNSQEEGSSNLQMEIESVFEIPGHSDTVKKHWPKSIMHKVCESNWHSNHSSSFSSKRNFRSSGSCWYIGSITEAGFTTVWSCKASKEDSRRSRVIPETSFKNISSQAGMGLKRPEQRRRGVAASALTHSGSRYWSYYWISGI